VVRSAMQLPVSKLPAFKLSTISSSRANSCLASVMMVRTRVLSKPKRRGLNSGKKYIKMGSTLLPARRQVLNTPSQC
jgi:hypothetical protein